MVMVFGYLGLQTNMTVLLKGLVNLQKYFFQTPID